MLAQINKKKKKITLTETIYHFPMKTFHTKMPRNSSRGILIP